MNLQSLSTCVGAFYCDSTGYDAIKKQLVDKTAYGNHLALKVGTEPIFSTRAGVEVMDFDNTYFFEGENLLKSGNSIVVVGVVKGSGADGYLSVVNSLARKPTAGDYDGVPDSTTDAEWFEITFGRTRLHFYANQPGFYNWNGNVSTAASFTNDLMNIFTGGISLQPAQLQGATGTEVVKTSNCSAGPFAARDGSTMRIGHLKSAGGLTAGCYLALKRVYFFCGNVFEHPDFVAARAAEIATWGIV